MGPSSHGHWQDDTVFAEHDLRLLRAQDELFRVVGDFDFGFDFGPPDYADVTEIYTPRYLNEYRVDRRCAGVSPHSRYRTQHGFGWTEDAGVRADRPPAIDRALARGTDAADADRLPVQPLLDDFVSGSEPAVFMIDLPEGHYQATLLLTDRSAEPRAHGPMHVAVVERFGRRPILDDVVVDGSELLVQRFDFNMVGSRYSNFRLELSAAPGADWILSGLTITRIEPHIAHLPVHRARPGEDLAIRATVTLPPQVLQPIKDSLSIARGTTSTIEPPDRITRVDLVYSLDGGRSERVREMAVAGDFERAAVIPAQELGEGMLTYRIEARDSIGQTVCWPAAGERARHPCRITADDAAPRVVHEPVAAWRAGEPLRIEARATDTSGVSRVVLHYRPTRQAMEYSDVPMRPDGSGGYAATIPGEVFTREFDVIYFLEAVDEVGNGAFWPDPARADPHLVVRVAR